MVKFLQMFIKCSNVALAHNGTVVGIAWEYQPIAQLSRNNPSNINHMLAFVYVRKT